MGSKKRRWTREECQAQYVQTSISQRALAKIARRHPSTIGKWASEGSWSDLREQHRKKYILLDASERVFLEKENEHDKTPQLLNQSVLLDLRKRNEDHARGFESFRATALQFNRALLLELSMLQSEKEKLSFLGNKAAAYDKYLSGYRTAVEGERKALGMHYLDINQAIEEVIRAGYVVSMSD